jgi:hypothetical protein
MWETLKIRRLPSLDLESAMPNKTKWETDIADIILELWMEEMDPNYYVTVDEVLPRMAERGHDMPRDSLTDAMGVVAADNNWQIEMTGDGSIKVLPFDPTIARS